MSDPDTGWPLQPLLIAVAGAGDEIDVERFDALVAEAAMPQWRLEVVDNVPDETRGVVLWLHVPEATGRQLDGQTDAEDLRVTQVVVGLAARLSNTVPVPLAVELDGEEIGYIEAGVPDRSLQVGLLDGWARVRDDSS